MVSVYIKPIKGHKTKNMKPYQDQNIKINVNLHKFIFTLNICESHSRRGNCGSARLTESFDSAESFGGFKLSVKILTLNIGNKK